MTADLDTSEFWRLLEAAMEFHLSSGDLVFRFFQHFAACDEVSFESFGLQNLPLRVEGEQLEMFRNCCFQALFCLSCCRDVSFLTSNTNLHIVLKVNSIVSFRVIEGKERQLQERFQDEFGVQLTISEKPPVGHILTLSGRSHLVKLAERELKNMCNGAFIVNCLQKPLFIQGSHILLWEGSESENSLISLKEYRGHRNFSHKNCECVVAKLHAPSASSRCELILKSNFQRVFVQQVNQLMSHLQDFSNVKASVSFGSSYFLNPTKVKGFNVSTTSAIQESIDYGANRRIRIRKSLLAEDKEFPIVYEHPDLESKTKSAGSTGGGFGDVDKKEKKISQKIKKRGLNFGFMPFLISDLVQSAEQYVQQNELKLEKESDYFSVSISHGRLCFNLEYDINLFLKNIVTVPVRWFCGDYVTKNPDELGFQSIRWYVNKDEHLSKEHELFDLFSKQPVLERKHDGLIHVSDRWRNQVYFVRFLKRRKYGLAGHPSVRFSWVNHYAHYPINLQSEEGCNFELSLLFEDFVEEIQNGRMLQFEKKFFSEGLDLLRFLHSRIPNHE
eukprot:TRINITY_DN11282_c0_g4_i1.p1 TRINITY_DN11282_c0_g4~~TRINITY_DN11282_c0_g4_i1.p1  ORF type:complete len:590 (+),score=139.53 TRINITY_DN11282_c0_g4_i1:98-1771(+)